MAVPRGASLAKGRPAGAGRDPFFDNAKFLLIVLVVVGHHWGPMTGAARSVHAGYLFVYAFHMPLFALLCGYFSRGFTGRPEQIRKLITTVLVPYLVFETVYAGMYTLCWGEPFSITPAQPRYLCWFLVALFVWRLSTPLWRAVRWPIVLALLISLAAGLTYTGDSLALAKVLGFLPWFVLGLCLRPAHFRPLRTVAARRCALPVLLGGVAAAYWASPLLGANWLGMEVGYADLGVSPERYLGTRCALFGVAAVLCAAFLALVPTGRTWFTVLGAVTMYPYLLHGLVIKGVESVGFHDLTAAGGHLAIVLTTVCAAALTVPLSSVPVRRVLRPVIEGRFPRPLIPRRERERSPS
ncbi:hypothetical protein E0L36_00810 [Streptomyces sp. AJS327]|uniref:acyltransferase family protein n=1 Tax=Streptomyces sp. AJS327 TaxID=2545265 RepID=UPI0015E05718|nr:acyltransferase family protein [Streptomyces sp. AJS327]MBA0049503.1 hypothetical protein [Streptomyces sp. AJS327]